MRTLFKEKISKFGSLSILIVLTAMLAIFSLALPEFVFSGTGRIFAVIWSFAAIIVFIAHATRISVGKKHYIPACRVKNILASKHTQKVKRMMLRG